MSATAAFFEGTGLVGGRAFVDDDNDGLRDDVASGTINGVSDVEVSLHDCATNAELAVDRTNTNGFYIFSGLIEGSYYVRAAPPEGGRWSFSRVWVAKTERGAPGLFGDYRANRDDDGPRARRRGRRELGGFGGGNAGSGTARMSGSYNEVGKSGNGLQHFGHLRGNVPKDSGAINEINQRRRGRRKLGTGGGPGESLAETNTIDPETGRTVICIELGDGEQAYGWGFGLFRASDGPSLQPSTSAAPTYAASNGPSEPSSHAPSISNVPTSSPSISSASPPSASGNPTMSSPPFASNVPTSKPSEDTSAPSLTVSVVAVEASKAPSRMPSMTTTGSPSSNNLYSGSGNDINVNEDNNFNDANNFDEAMAENNNGGGNNSSGNNSSNNYISDNYIVLTTWGIAFAVLAAALLVYFKRYKGNARGPPTTILAPQMDHDEISELHVSRRLQRGASRRPPGLSEVSEEGGDESSGDATTSDDGTSTGGNSGWPTLSVEDSGDGSLASSQAIERSWSSNSVDEEAPLSRSESFAQSPSDVPRSSHSPRNDAKAPSHQRSQEWKRVQKQLSRSLSSSSWGAPKSRRPSRKYAKRLSHPGSHTRWPGMDGPLSRSFPDAMTLETSSTVSPVRGAPSPRKGERKMQNAPISPMRSMSSRERKAVKRKTIRSIERELVSLTTALDSFPKDSQTWLLLNGYLNRAKEELEEAIEGLERRAASNVARQPQPYDAGGVGNASNDTGIPNSTVMHHDDDKFVCGMELTFGGARGKFTGQIDSGCGLPHGLGTFRKDDDGNMLEGEWHLGEFVNKIRTSVGGVSVVGVSEGGGRAALVPSFPVAPLPRRKKTTLVTPLPGRKKEAGTGGTANRRRDDSDRDTLTRPSVALLGQRSRPLLADAALEERIEIIPPPGDVGVILDSGARGKYVGRIDLESQLPHGRGTFRTDDGGAVLEGEWHLGELVEEIETGDGGAGTFGIGEAGSQVALAPPLLVAPLPQAPEEGPPEMALDLYNEERSSVASEDNSRSASSLAQSFISHPDVDKIYNDMVSHYQECESVTTAESDLPQLLFGDDLSASQPSSLDNDTAARV